MRLRAALGIFALVVLACLSAAGCGGSGGEATPDNAGRGDQTLQDLWQAPGDDVTVVPGTSTYEPGLLRVSFVVTDAAGDPVTLPTAHVWLSRALEQPPFLETTASLERIGVPGGATADSTHVYVSHFRVRTPGKYWLLAEPEGGPKVVHALGNVVVVSSTGVPEVGDAAPRSDTPTLTSAGGDPGRVTTRTPPDLALLQHSVAESLAEHMPFVVTFATPKFCTSRTCTPVVDVVEEVARRFDDSRVRFIHVEVYEDLNPALGPNRWMKEWGLRTEPWTFLVNADGRVAARFEGPVSVRELEDAVHELLGG
jgi:hypothetical protein